ncbi:hypothetical protein RUE5091_03858 [Ruegeria denitrificans]|uniref:YjiS-like domain-containing protein n=1 Tax=Ruegeria denitrificans TaxID=1715692 RepID=A0A0P1IR59_9RHOB|nr:DUF1127 domain-containing protein [Ruegeria denitrificans]CUK15263.1 hypothetical protein RUE5091_03858 [Ruegeria denitrificans]
MAYTATSTHGGFNPIARFGQFIADMKQAFTLRSEYNRTYSELQSLTDRELNDIGVRRCDIKDIAHDHVYCS